MRLRTSLGVASACASVASAALKVTEDNSTITLANDRLTSTFAKDKGRVSELFLDGQDLLGPISGNTGVGPYLDCYCIPSGFYTAGSTDPRLEVVQGTDSTGTKYAGVILNDTYTPTGQQFQQYWFLRDGETGLHTFSRLAYYNETTPFLRNLQEFRTLFRPNTELWTHLTSSEAQTAPLPSKEAIANEGPLHSDLTVDGIVYNYLVSNHHGEGTPNITNGFDRTFGPQYYLFNGGKGSESSLEDLRSEAETLADPGWNADFYDSIAKHVIGYAPSSKRGSVQGQVKLPKGSTRPIAILTVDGQYFQDNSVEASSHQYWAEMGQDGTFQLDHVKEDKYRLTVFADGIFGDFVHDGVEVQAGKATKVQETWEQESAGVEVWRLGTPDKSSGEFLHGDAPDPTHPLHPPQHFIYWGAYDWQQDFPNGVNYTIGSSDPAVDFNTVHWSVYGPTPENPDVEYDTTHDWTINFSLDKKQLQQRKTATLTIQLAGAKTAAGNTDVYNATEPYANLALESYINEQKEPLTLLVGFNQSSSCIVRSAVSCYQVRSRMEFPADWLNVGNNVLTLHLPRNATDYETAVLPGTVYVQYDALRLELA
ncbi:unnamed protein product [Aspergillus oryzae]|uniref:rhamnogalacturonan endolyase n=1 Tax=Aspergillus oryzae var. brunneus TaxID=332754 RepID=A0ABQ6KL67_ASPOZ|nr:unnamed protein product [Aspergillus oryzae]GMF91092.1 unnamed protein product [Aspergillus oryzae]GMG12329.1 unnamed protein product [Aspergillus oryzae]GMG43275.1 unnamed protein product [Aspergillus oryzae var. brunneus]